MPQKTPAQGGKGTEGRPPFILIVDDDRSLRDTLQYVLTQEFPYCRISTAGDRALALSLADQERPSLLLLDYHLQQDTGIDIFDALHAEIAPAAQTLRSRCPLRTVGRLT